MPFFVEALDLHVKCSTAVAITECSFVREVTHASRTVTFVAMEMLKNVPGTP